MCLASVALPASTWAAPTALNLAIVDGAVSYGTDNTLKVNRGDPVELHWTSDRPVELHMHGYDLLAKVAPDAPAVMSFKATIPGRFPVEMHGQGKGHHAALLYVEVLP